MARRRRGGHRMTPKRRAALKKAQAASARKRKGMGRGKKVAIGLGIATVAAVSAHKLSGSQLSIRRRSSMVSGQVKRTTVHAPLQFNAAGFRTGGGTSTVVGVHKAPRGFMIGRTGNTISAAAGGIIGSYRFGRARQVVTGSRARSAVDVDSIPVYKQKSQKGWPHVGADKAREQNSRLREAGMIR